MIIRIIYIITLLFFIVSCKSEPPRSLFNNKNKKSEEITRLDNHKEKLKKRNKRNAYSKLINNTNVKKKLIDFGKKNLEKTVSIKTDYGTIVVELYDDTPLHRANFIMLAKRNFFDSTLFYRVIRNFIIQGGNSDKPYNAPVVQHTDL